MTTLSRKGQVIIPKAIRASHPWEDSLALVVIDTSDGICKPHRNPFTAYNFLAY